MIALIGAVELYNPYWASAVLAVLFVAALVIILRLPKPDTRSPNEDIEAQAELLQVRLFIYLFIY